MLRVVGCVIASALLVVAWAAGAGQGEGLPESLLKEVGSTEKLPKGRYTLVKTWEAEGKEAGHRYGRVVADPEGRRAAPLGRRHPRRPTSLGRPRSRR
jgi:hypothetical protein